jgi:hypothetical protein
MMTEKYHIYFSQLATIKRQGKLIILYLTKFDLCVLSGDRITVRVRHTALFQIGRGANQFTAQWVTKTIVRSKTAEI